MKSRPILLVEDNDDDVMLTKRALREDNVVNELIVAHDGVEAWQYMQAAAEGKKTVPAVILLDLNLPRMDGLEVLAKIRADPKLRLQPVIMLTSSKEEKDVIHSYDLGVNSYIRKPVDYEQFCAAIRQLHLYWLVLNEPPPPTTGTDVEI